MKKGIIAVGVAALLGAAGLALLNPAGVRSATQSLTAGQTVKLAAAERSEGDQSGGQQSSGQQGQSQGQAKPDHVTFRLVPSSAAIAKCIPHAKVTVTVKLRTDATGRDIFLVDASGMPANTSFTTFLLEQPGAPFGAAEYIGDVNTDRYGRAHAEFRLIVEEAFSSTIVNGTRVRAELNHVGMWFADPAADDFCFGKGGGAVTPFDGDNEAGVQAFNSRNADPLPAP